MDASEDQPLVLTSDNDLQWALKQLTDGRRRGRLDETRDYYDGIHRLAFATEKFRETFGRLFSAFAENMCPGVVDAFSDRLEIKEFESSEKTTSSMDIPNPLPGVPPRTRVDIKDDLATTAMDLWERCHMNEKAPAVHQEALTMGDGYVIVWPDKDMNAEIWAQDSENIVVDYDPEYEGKIRRAAKLWQVDDGRYRLNLYFPDRIEKYVTRGKKVVRPTFTDWKQFEPIATDEGPATVPNPYGVVPVFHFSNRAVHKPGISELKDVIPLQDGLNKSVADMLVTMEYAAFKQRWVIGMEIEIDPATGQPVDQMLRSAGIDRMMAIPDPDAKVGQFDATDLSQFLKVQEKFWKSVSRTTGIPLHYFFIDDNGPFPTREAMPSAEGRFHRKIERKQVAFGTIWEKVVKFALYIDGNLTADQFSSPKEENEVTFEVVWEPASPPSQTEIADTAVKKKAVGVSPSQILKELGYDNDLIDNMLNELQSQQLANTIATTPPGTPGQTSGAPNAPATKQRTQTRNVAKATVNDGRTHANRARAGAQPG